MDAESSHDRRRVVLTLLGPGRAICEPNGLAFVPEIIIIIIIIIINTVFVYAIYLAIKPFRGAVHYMNIQITIFFK